MKRSTYLIVAVIVGVGVLIGSAVAPGQSKTTPAKQSGQIEGKKAVTGTEQAKPAKTSPAAQSKEVPASTTIKQSDTKAKTSAKEKKQPAATKAKKMASKKSNPNAPQQKEAARKQNNQ